MPNGIWHRIENVGLSLSSSINWYLIFGADNSIVILYPPGSQNVCYPTDCVLFPNTSKHVTLTRKDRSHL